MKYKFLIITGILLVSCSKVLDFGDECNVDQDCISKHGDGWACDKTSHLCFLQTSISDEGMNDQVGEVEDQGSKPPVPKAPCLRIYGIKPDEVGSPDVILIGSLLAYSGELSADGPKIDKGVELAVTEINQAGGLFGKKLGVLSCDDGTDASVGLQSAKQMVETFGVPAIIGATPSAVTIEVFNQVAKPKDVLMISPSATSPLLSNLPDNGLLWRTAPSDAIQGAGIAAYLKDLKPSKLAVVVRDDAYGNGLKEVIYDRYCKTKTPPCSDKDFLAMSYNVDDPAKTSTDQSKIVTQIKKLMPEVIVLVSFYDDGIQFINFAAEEMMKIAEWKQSFKRFVLTDGMMDPIIMDKNKGIKELQIKCNIVGTIAKGQGSAYDEFRLRYKAKFQEEPGSYSAHAYDAMYLLGYAMATVQDNDLPFTGKKIAEGLKRLSSGLKVNAGASEWNKTIQILHNNSKSTIDYEGASGSLNFDNSTGEAPSDIEMWRLDLDEGKIKTLGIVYTSDGKYIQPSFDPKESGKECEIFSMSSR